MAAPISALGAVNPNLTTGVLFREPVPSELIFDVETKRFYFPRAGVPHVQPSYDAEWDITTNSVKRFLPAVKSPTGSTSSPDTSANFAKTAAAVQDIVHGQFTSGPLAAQTISGNAKLIVRGGETTGTDDAHLQVIIRVVSNDGSTVRGTLYSGYTGALLSSNQNGAGIGREFSTATQNRVASMDLTPVTTLDGDRLVVEVGQRFTNAGSATGSGYLAFGDISSQTDQSFLDDASNGTGQANWIEFDHGIELSTIISDFYVDSNGTAIPTRSIPVPVGVTPDHQGLVVFAVNSQVAVTWNVSITGAGTITLLDSIAGATAYFHVYKVTGARYGDYIKLTTSPSSRCIALQSRWEKGITYGTPASAVRPASQNTTTSGSTTPAAGQRVLVLAVDRTATNTITGASSSGGETVQFESYDRIDTTQPVMGIYWGEFVASAAAARTATITVATAAGSGYCAVIPISVVTSTTAVGKDSGLLWNTGAAVGDTTTLRHNTRAVIADTSQIVYAVRTAIGDDSSIVWATRASAGDSTILRHNTRALASDTSQLVHNTRGAIGDTSQLIYNVRTAIGDPTQLIWGVRALAGDPTQLVWNTRAALGDTSVLRWNTRAFVGDTSQLVWAVRTALGDSSQLVWRTVALAGNNSQLVWAVRTAVGDPSQLVWNLRQASGDNSTLVWNVLQTALTATDSTVLRWNTRAAVSDTSTLVHNTRASVGDNSQLAWAVRTALGDTSVLRWNTRAALGDTSSLTWNTRAALGDTTTLRHNTRAALGDTTTVRYNTRATVADTSQLIYNVRTTIGDASVLRHATRAASGDQSSLRWNTRAPAGDDSNLRYNVRDAVNADSVLRYAVRTDTFKDTSLVWSVTQTIGDTSTLLHRVLTPVGDETTLRWGLETLFLSDVELEIYPAHNRWQYFPAKPRWEIDEATPRWVVREVR